MCFTDDYDWCASAVTNEHKPAASDLKCDECDRIIPAGELYHYTYQQEHEECQRCEDHECNCVNWDDDSVNYCDDCKCESPDYGETFSYDCCEECHQFLDAIKQTEQAEGCPPEASQPPLGMMLENLAEFDEDAEKYFTTAKTLYPNLEASGYLERIRQRVF